MAKKPSSYFCSFCGKAQSEVQQLIAGPTVFICDECVDLCASIVAEQRAKHPAAVPAEPKPSNDT